MRSISGIVGIVGLCATLAAATAWADRYVVPPETPGANPQSPYGSWDVAATDIVVAVVGASIGETVWITNGVYYPTNAIVVAKSQKVRGFSGNPADTIIVGMPFRVWTGADAMLDALTVSNCTWCSGIEIASRILVTNCAVRKCSHNYQNGGGIAVKSGADGTLIVDCVIADNANTHTTHYGGGLALACPVTVDRCIISGNTVINYGGGVDLNHAQAVLRNCLIVGNQQTTTLWRGAGGIDLRQGVLENCTVVSNSGHYRGGGIRLGAGGYMTNSVAWGNIDTSGSGFTNLFNDGGTSTRIVYSDVGTAIALGEGSIKTDPLFVGGSDYHLQSGSPCKDTGTNVEWTAAGLDLDRKTRKYNDRVDMGAYEYQPTYVAPKGTVLLVR